MNKHFKKTVLLIIIAFININYQKMDYQVIDWRSANDLKNHGNVNLIKQLEFNFSKVYLLNRSSYLIMPLNPFGNCLVTSKKELLSKWINEQYFPSGDETNNFYFENKNKIDNLIANKSELVQELCRYVYHEKKKCVNGLSAQEIDNVYKILKEKKKYQKYKLNFIVLVGEHILNQCKHLNYHWGLLRNKQFLNPTFNLIIVTNENEKLYYNLEEKINGKFGYVGVHYYLKSISNKLISKENEIAEVAKIM